MGSKVAGDGDVHFLPDEPSDEDFFASHQKIANAIASVIRRQPELKAIGLLGRWGSGKSTIVRLTEKVFASDRSEKLTRFFYYDAWLHQSDPVRRSFLESLAHNLETAAPSAGKEWAQQLAVLRGQREEKETIKVPLVTTAGAAILVSLIGLPVGLSFLNRDIFEKALANPPSKTALAMLEAGFLLVALPIIIAFLVYMAWRPAKSEGPKENLRFLFSRKFWITHKAPHENDSILSLFLSKTIEKSRDITMRSGEPTVIEFQDFFRTIMASIVARNERLVVVIDNLDRLPDAQALELWSTVRSLFLGASETPVLQRAAELPTVIIPIDDSAVARLLEGDKSRSGSRGLAESFMDKTFDVTFRVPEPVMSDWREFLSAGLHASFKKNVQERDIYWCTKIFAEKRRHDGLIVTPRLLNRFINRTLSLFVQRQGDKISLPCIAYYSAFVHLMQEDLAKFLVEPPVKITPPAADWQNQVAALHFGVTVDKAAQVLLADPIRDAIAELDTDTFERLSRIPGFTVELERLIENPPLVGPDQMADFTFITNACLLLSDLKNPSEAWKSEAWKTLTRYYISSTNPDAAPEDLEIRLAAVLVHAADVGLESDVVIASSVKVATMLVGPAVESSSVAVAIRAADQLVGEAGRHKVSNPVFFLPVDAAKFLRILMRASNRPRVWKSFRTSLGIGALVESLAAQLNSPLLHTGAIPVLRILLNADFQKVLTVPAQADWAPVVVAATEVLRSSSGADGTTGTSATVLGLLRPSVTDAASGIEELIDQGHLTTRLNEAVTGKNWEVLSAGFAFLIAKGIDFAAPGNSAWSDLLTSYPRLISNTEANLHAFYGPVIAPQVWRALRQAPTARPIIMGILERMLSDGSLGNLHVENTITSLQSYLGPLDSPMKRRFLARLRRYTTFWEALEAVPMDANFRQIVKSFRTASASDKDKVRALLQRRMDAATMQEWTDAVEKGGNLLEAALESSGSCELNWGAHGSLFNGLRAFVPQLLGTRNTAVVRRWFHLSRLFVPKIKNELLKSVAEEMAGGGYVGERLAIAREGGMALLTSRGFNRETAIRVLVVPLLETSAGRKWVETNKEDLSKFLVKSSQEAKHLMQVALDRLGRSKNALRRSWALQMAEFLHLR